MGAEDLKRFRFPSTFDHPPPSQLLAPNEYSFLTLSLVIRNVNALETGAKNSADDQKQLVSCLWIQKLLMLVPYCLSAESEWLDQVHTFDQLRHRCHVNLLWWSCLKMTDPTIPTMFAWLDFGISEAIQTDPFRLPGYQGTHNMHDEMIPQ